jgi:hypothetical protein
VRGRDPRQEQRHQRVDRADQDEHAAEGAPRPYWSLLARSAASFDGKFAHACQLNEAPLRAFTRKW